MANREDILRMVAELENEEPVFWRDTLLKNYKEALTTAEFDPCRRLDGRSASRELWEYEESIAEIRREKEARTRKFMTKHEVRNDGHPVKKEKKKKYDKRKHYNCDFYRGMMPVRKYREIEKEKADARDRELEENNIAEFAMWQKINFDMETERLKALHEWLKYA